MSELRLFKAKCLPDKIEKERVTKSYGSGYIIKCLDHYESYALAEECECVCVCVARVCACVFSDFPQLSVSGVLSLVEDLFIGLSRRINVQIFL